MYKCPRDEEVLDENMTCPKCAHDFSADIKANQNGELSRWQIEAGDLIDSAIIDLVGNFVRDPEWDQAWSGPIRDALVEVLQEHFGIPEYDVYPWMIEPEEEVQG
jgi:hypothetical protein